MKCSHSIFYFILTSGNCDTFKGSAYVYAICTINDRLCRVWQLSNIDIGAGSKIAGKDDIGNQVKAELELTIRSICYRLNGIKVYLK